MEWLCLRLVCVFVLLIEGAVDLDLLVSALVLEEVDGGFSSMSVLLPFGLICFGPGRQPRVQRPRRHFEKSRTFKPRRSNVSIISARA